ncbi:hypothetical protein RND81_04G180300 [Saponaria officinalis]
MAKQLLKSVLNRLNGSHFNANSVVRSISSVQYVATRARDPTFEKYMDNYKNFVKVIAIQDLILANPSRIPPSVSVDFLSRLSQKLHLNRGALSFLRKYPHVFEIFYNQTKSMPFCKLTDKVTEVSQLEATAIREDLPLVVERLVRILSMTMSKSLPLRAVFKVWRELGLPDDFEESVISRNPQLFSLCDGNEPNTHVLKLVTPYPVGHFTAAVEDWRVVECCKEDAKVDRTEIQYSFKQGFPPQMKLRKSFKMKVREWQKQPYVGPYEAMGAKKRTKSGMKMLEKRAVAIVHEFMNLTVEKMIEVEKISHFRKWFGIDLNVRDLFLDHPGIFYLSTKGRRHTVFLREAYERGRLINSNPVYEARMKLLYLVMMGRRGLLTTPPKSTDVQHEGDDQISVSSVLEDVDKDH